MIINPPAINVNFNVIFVKGLTSQVIDFETQMLSSSHKENHRMNFLPLLLGGDLIYVLAFEWSVQLQRIVPYSCNFFLSSTLASHVHGRLLDSLCMAQRPV